MKKFEEFKENINDKVINEGIDFDLVRIPQEEASTGILSY